MTVAAGGPLPVDPYPWRHLPVSFALLVASWAALLAWLYGGSDGAGNLFMAWTWFLAVVYTIAAMVRPTRLAMGAPVPLRFFFRFSACCQLGLLAWFGCWWLFSAGLWSLVMTAAQRQYVDKRLAAQGVPHV